MGVRVCVYMYVSERKTDLGSNALLFQIDMCHVCRGGLFGQEVLRYTLACWGKVRGGGCVSVCVLHVKYLIYILLFHSGPEESRGVESPGQHCAV